MTLTLSPELEVALVDKARKQGVDPETLALKTLKDVFILPASPFVSHEEWKRRLRMIATDCGVSLSNEAVSSEGVYG